MAAPKDKAGAQRSAEEMFPLMEQYEASGQSQQAFWEEQGLPRSAFHYWLRRYRLSKQARPSEAEAFMPLEISHGPKASPSLPKAAIEACGPAAITITFSDGTRVEARGQVEASFIRQILGR
ncbi:MAG: hypothetical protein H6559_06755 [Lewinellaceae bacterium]|nr:hypothetical protein [Lewinellaceae bacterium]